MPVSTLSIDAFVDQEKLDKLDLIKMDIECAELPSLRGAVNAIRRFKPKLAISVYHNPRDLIEIPFFIRSLNEKFGLNYKMFLDHFTIHGEETVLFCRHEST